MDAGFFVIGFSLHQLVHFLRPSTSLPGTAGAVPAVEVTLERLLLGRVALAFCLKYFLIHLTTEIRVRANVDNAISHLLEMIGLSTPPFLNAVRDYRVALLGQLVRFSYASQIPDQFFVSSIILSSTFSIRTFPNSFPY